MTRWNAVPLGDVAESVDYGLTASASDQPIGPKFLRITDIQNGAVNWNKVPWCARDSRGGSTARLKPGDIVFARTGATTGKSYLIRECPVDAVFASYLIRVRLGNSADPLFVSHFFQTVDYWEQITKSARGVAQPGINATTLSKLRIPLPPIVEQRRIAEILDKADALRIRRRTALTRLDALTDAMFLDIFGDPVTNPKRWRVSFLGEVAETTSGGTPSRDVGIYFNGEIPWVKSGELHQSVVTATEERLTAEGIENSSAKLMPPDTVMVAMYGATVGAVAILGIEAATNQAVCCIPPTKEINPYYLASLLRKLAPNLLAKRVGGAQPNLSQDLIRRLSVPVPDLAFQVRFAESVIAITRVKRYYERSLKQLDSLFACLQHRAFRGEL